MRFMHNEAHILSAKHECQLSSAHVYPSLSDADVSKDQWGGACSAGARVRVSDVCAKRLSLAPAINYTNNIHRMRIYFNNAEKKAEYTVQSKQEATGMSPRTVNPRVTRPGSASFHHLFSI